MQYTFEDLFVFDIETIPDTEVVDNLLDFSVDNSLEAQEKIDLKRKALENYHLSITNGNNAFLRQPFHKVVALSFLRAKVSVDGFGKEFYSLKEIRSGGVVDSSEKDLVEGFFKTIDKLKPRLVSFNGRVFDMPVLKYRAMKYGIKANTLYNSGDKWSSYQSRYGVDWHCDLIDVLSDFGASTRVKLNEVCSILNLPGKIGIDGSKVFSMFDKGQLKQIRNYCETDVLNTYLVYLHLMNHMCKISEQSFELSISEIKTFLEESSDKEHWREFNAQWDNLCNSQ